MNIRTSLPRRRSCICSLAKEHGIVLESAWIQWRTGSSFLPPRVWKSHAIRYQTRDSPQNQRGVLLKSKSATSEIFCRYGCFSASFSVTHSLLSPPYATGTALVFQPCVLSHQACSTPLCFLSRIHGNGIPDSSSQQTPVPMSAAV